MTALERIADLEQRLECMTADYLRRHKDACDRRDLLLEIVAAEDDFRKSTGQRSNDRMSDVIDLAREYLEFKK